MGVYLKVGGEWVEATRPFVKVNGSWIPSKSVYVKDAGVWESAYQYDLTPPEAPTLSLTLVEPNSSARHIQVGAKVGSVHDPELKRIRVLSTYNGAAPTTQYGGTYTSEPQTTYPNEPWSDFYFNGYSGSNENADSSQYRYKTWIPNATDSTGLVGDKTHYFAAWAEDINGNWSSGTFSSIFVPKQNSTPGSSTLPKEMSFRAYTSGSYTGSGYEGGLVIQSNSPRSRGVYFYADDIKQKIGKEGTPKIKSAQIFVHRRDDSGRPRADLWIFWHDYGYPGQIGADLIKNDILHLGRISKAESKWFNLPAEYLPLLESNTIKGFGFNFRSDPNPPTENDYSVLKAVDDKPRAGEVHIVWEESL